jgi:hypothetical protein
MESRTSPGPATLRHHDAVLGCCRRAGFSVAMAAHAFSFMDSDVDGFVLQEVNLPFVETSDMRAAVAEMLPTASGDAYPYLTELTVQRVLLPGYRYGDEFGPRAGSGPRRTRGRRPPLNADAHVGARPPPTGRPRGVPGRACP